MQRRRRGVQPRRKDHNKFGGEGEHLPALHVVGEQRVASWDCFLKSGEETQDLICSCGVLFPLIPADMQYSSLQEEHLKLLNTDFPHIKGIISEAVMA